MIIDQDDMVSVNQELVKIKGRERMENKAGYLNIKQAALICGVTPTTLRNWEKAGKIKPFYTPGKHRRYTQVILDEAMKAK